MTACERPAASPCSTHPARTPVGDEAVQWRAGSRLELRRRLLAVVRRRRTAPARRTSRVSRRAGTWPASFAAPTGAAGLAQAAGQRRCSRASGTCATRRRRSTTARQRRGHQRHPRGARPRHPGPGRPHHDPRRAVALRERAPSVHATIEEAPRRAAAVARRSSPTTRRCGAMSIASCAASSTTSGGRRARRRTAEEAYSVRVRRDHEAARGRRRGLVTCEIGLQPPWPAEFVVVRIGVPDAQRHAQRGGGEPGWLRPASRVDPLPAFRFAVRVRRPAARRLQRLHRPRSRDRVHEYPEGGLNTTCSASRAGPPAEPRAQARHRRPRAVGLVSPTSSTAIVRFRNGSILVHDAVRQRGRRSSSSSVDALPGEVDRARALAPARATSRSRRSSSPTMASSRRI